MARPTKQGVDYFPLDVHLDDKFKFIEIKYKLEGFAILVKLLQKIYSCGYWYRWTEDEALLFSDEIRADYNLVIAVVNESLERGVFDKGLHQKHQILTSKGIQKRYKEMVRRRKDVEVIDDYLLIDNILIVNDVINPSDNRHDDGKSTQSKVNKSKVNKNINTVFEYWNSKNVIIHKKLNAKMQSHINARLEDYELDILLKAIDNYETVLNNDQYYWTHRWTLEDFMKPNKMVKFLDSSKPFETYAAKKSKTSKEVDWEGFNLE